MAQEAYNFAHFETRAPAQERKAQPANPLRSVRGGKRKPSGLQKVFGNLLQVMLVLFFFGTAFFLVRSEAKLTEYTQQIQNAEAELTVAQSEYNYLETTLNASINLQQVEKVVKELGLVKVDESQVTYIRIEEDAVITTADSTFAQWLAAARDIWAQALEYLDL